MGWPRTIWDLLRRLERHSLLTFQTRPKSNRRNGRLLRVRRERPHRRAAKQRDEGAALHSIASSARASSVDRRDFETERPRRFDIDHQVVFGWRLHGKVGWFFALKDAI